jgi:hypothetical protein
MQILIKKELRPEVVDLTIRVTSKVPHDFNIKLNALTFNSVSAKIKTNLPE